MFLVGDVIKYAGKLRTVMAVGDSEVQLKEVTRGTYSTAQVSRPTVKSRLLRLAPEETAIQVESIGYLQWRYLLPDGREVLQLWDKDKANGRAFKWHLDGHHYPITDFWQKLYNS